MLKFAFHKAEYCGKDIKKLILGITKEDLFLNIRSLSVNYKI